MSKKTVTVPLFGRRGSGQKMLVDAASWNAVRAAGWLEEFRLVYERKSGRDYVLSKRHPSRADRRAIPLARLIVNAKPGQAVFYLNGNTLDLRGENLFVGTRGEVTKLIGAKRVNVCPACGHRFGSSAASRKAVETLSGPPAQ